MLLNEVLTVLSTEEMKLFSSIPLAFLSSGFFFLDLPSWVCIYSLNPVTLTNWTSGFRYYSWLLMSPKFSLLVLVFLCMIYLHTLDFILFLKMLFLWIVTTNLNSFPTSSSVLALPSSRPKRRRRTFCSLSVNVLKTSTNCHYQFRGLKISSIFHLLIITCYILLTIIIAFLEKSRI